MATTKYCDLSDLVKLVPYQTIANLSNDAEGAVEPDLDVIDGLIEAISENIDGKLRGRYPVPLPEVPTILKYIAVKKLRFDLYSRRPDGGDLPSAVVAANKEANDDLASIESGKLQLGIADSGSAMPEPGPWRVKAPPRRFNPGG